MDHGSPQDSQAERCAPARELLAGYSEVLDSIAARPAIVFLSRQYVPQGQSGQHFRLPRANALAAILAELHVAARVDALLRRGQRFRALDPRGPSTLDLDRLQDFRDSLSPVRRRTLTLWIVLLALAVAFPVAWITDYLRVLAPVALICSSRFSVRAGIARFTGTTPGPVTAGCRPHARAGLVEALVRVAHLNLSPGSVVDALSSARSSGLVVVLLLAVIWALCLTVVLLPFRSGFRLKRLAFSTVAQTPARNRSLIWSELRSEGLYRLEREVFTSVGLRRPREFALDLAVSAGTLVLPLTIAVELLIIVTLPRLDFVTTAILAVGACGLIAAVLLRLHWLIGVWSSRTDRKVIALPERQLPDESTILVHSGRYTFVLLLAGYIIAVISAVAQPGVPVPLRIFEALLLAPVLVWSLAMAWWYRLHRDLSACGRSVGLLLVRTPILSIVAPLSLAGTVIIGFVWNIYTSAFVGAASDLLFLFGLISMPVSVYHLGRNLAQLRLRATSHRDRKIRAAGLRAAIMVLAPVPAVPYFQHSFNQISQELTTAAEPPRTDAVGAPPQPLKRPDARPGPSSAMPET